MEVSKWKLYFVFSGKEIASGTYDLLLRIRSFGNYQRISGECFELIMM
jgi:hypothetical protein